VGESGAIPSEVGVRVEVGAARAEIEPVAPIEHDASDCFAGADEIEENRDHRERDAGRDIVEDFGFEQVEAGEEAVPRAGGPSAARMSVTRPLPSSNAMWGGPPEPRRMRVATLPEAAWWSMARSSGRSVRISPL